MRWSSSFLEVIRLFEWIGRKFVKGAKAEIEESVMDDEGSGLLMKSAEILLEIGFFAFLLVTGGKPKKHNGDAASTVIINNYLQKGE